MGWEDLVYGWQLASSGWLQLRCSDAVFVDDYEHRQVRLLGRRIFIHDKPAWISYYTTRNLALFVRRSNAGWRGWTLVFWRWLQESCLILLYKEEKRHRLKLLWRGLRDGFRGLSGMVSSPTSEG
jgi:hypothetical protein